MKPIVIGVTDCSKYNAYANWIASVENVDVVKLAYNEGFDRNLKKCNALLLTGGEDVHPRFYNKLEYLPYCYPDDINEKRDEFELKALAFSQQNNLPVLGICRGLQIANVFFGGTLIPDIPVFKKSEHSKDSGSGYDRYHAVQVELTSLLKQIVQSERGEVNSAHHQSAEVVADDLRVNAYSPDGIVEGLEWKNPSGKPYLMLVQWHPERMKDQASMFTKNIRTNFIEAVRSVV